jgi:hypothetical protein
MTTTAPVPAAAAAAVAIVHWPRDATARVRARATGTPRLLLIEPGTAPPTDCALDEDWSTTTAPPDDVAARLATLATRKSRRHPLPADLAADLDDAAIAVYDVLAASAPLTVPRSRLDDVAHGDPTAVLTQLRRVLRGGDVTIVTVPGGVLLAGVQRTR